eukprot:TRINITY_DN5994_c1_g4_i2.p1 TRINITY_DN5994_c1_g4~~TRINITY_DN5994_c1_g4_i2.p1  ORF type:complete len:1022 (+),score=83.53 TRINITY_DN5994_c1_g4_i2:82-3147(+)
MQPNGSNLPASPRLYKAPGSGRGVGRQQPPRSASGKWRGKGRGRGYASEPSEPDDCYSPPVVMESDNGDYIVAKGVKEISKYFMRHHEVGLMHTRMKLAVGTLRHAHPNTREDLAAKGCKRRFDTTIPPDRIPELISCLENANFMKQTPPQNIEKSRRWQIYIKKGDKRTHTAYISNDGRSENIIIRKLLRDVDYPTLKKLRYDVLNHNSPCSRDFRVRVETHRLCSEDNVSDKEVLDWLQSMLVNSKGNLCPPVVASDIQFECIRRKHKHPERTQLVKTEHCGTWRNGKIKFQIQWVEQTVAAGYRGPTEPNYEVCLTCTELCKTLKMTRLPLARSPQIDIYSFAPLIYGLLTSIVTLFKTSMGGGVESLYQILDGEVQAAPESDFKIVCQRNGLNSEESRARHLVETEAQIELQKTRNWTENQLRELSERELLSQPCYTDWEARELTKKVKRNGTSFGATELVSTSGKWGIARTKRRYGEWQAYFEIEVLKGTRNTSTCKIGWLNAKISKGWEEAISYDGQEVTTKKGSVPSIPATVIGQGDIIGSQADFDARLITFYINERLVATWDLPDDITHLHPMIGLFNFDVVVSPQVAPPGDVNGRDNTMPLSEEGEANPYDPITPQEDAFDSVYSRYTGYDLKNAHADDEPTSCTSEDANYAAGLPSEFFIGFDTLSSDWKKVGEGGFGKVYKCEKQDVHDEVAVKELTNRTRDSKKKFVKEIEVLLGLRYNRILACYGWSESMPDGTLYMITEFCHGGTLKSKLEQLPPGADERLTIAIQVGVSMAQALSHLHSQGVVHLDVAARNVLLTVPNPTGIDCYKLADVGLLAKERDPIQAICIPWAPPEVILLQHSERRATKAHDSWSLGCLLYEVLQGEPYFDDCERGREGWKEHALTELKAKRRPRQPTHLHTPISMELWNVIHDKLWDLDPVSRPVPQPVVTILQKLEKLERQQSSIESMCPNSSIASNVSVQSSSSGGGPALTQLLPSVQAQPPKSAVYVPPRAQAHTKIKTLRGRRGKN